MQEWMMVLANPAMTGGQEKSKSMKWKDFDNADDITDEIPDDIIDETEYPLWEKRKKSSLKGGLFKKIEIPFILVGVGILILTGFFVASLFGNAGSIDSEKIDTLEKRLVSLEDRLQNIQTSESELNQITEQRAQVEQIQNKIDQLETSIALRMDQISTEILSLKRQPANVEPQVPPAVNTPAEPEKKRYHQVRSGDTLYGIGRKYGISVQELRQLNNLRSGAVIRPGQKLVIGRSE
jgi:LysM repeat protein